MFRTYGTGRAFLGVIYQYLTPNGVVHNAKHIHSEAFISQGELRDEGQAEANIVEAEVGEVPVTVHHPAGPRVDDPATAANNTAFSASFGARRIKRNIFVARPKRF